MSPFIEIERRMMAENQPSRYSEYLARVALQDRELADRIAPLRTLEHILEWLPKEGVALSTLDMVTQDEYCHDLYFPLPRSANWLVFAMT